ncbi:MAG: hypothetical protein ACYTBJ_24955 [Planctomycetota bacterium]|jgi:hypothetical protein
MNLEQLQAGIEEALYKGFLARVERENVCPNCREVFPEPEKWWAEFIQEASLYLFELTKRFKERNMPYDVAKRKAA